MGPISPFLSPPLAGGAVFMKKAPWTQKVQGALVVWEVRSQAAARFLKTGFTRIVSWRLGPVDMIWTGQPTNSSMH